MSAIDQIRERINSQSKSSKRRSGNLSVTEINKILDSVEKSNYKCTGCIGELDNRRCIDCNRNKADRYEPATVEDRIRVMTHEELSDFLTGFASDNPAPDKEAVAIWLKTKLLKKE